MGTKALFIFGILLLLLFIEAASHKTSMTDYYDASDPNLDQFTSPVPGRLQRIPFTYVGAYQ